MPPAATRLLAAPDWRSARRSELASAAISRRCPGVNGDRSDFFATRLCFGEIANAPKRSASPAFSRSMRCFIVLVSAFLGFAQGILGRLQHRKQTRHNGTWIVLTAEAFSGSRKKVRLQPMTPGKCVLCLRALGCAIRQYAEFPSSHRAMLADKTCYTKCRAWRFGRP
jgi:hypothetical protein